MKAAVFEAPRQPLQVRDIADPTPAAGQVVVRVQRCGICMSDVHVTEAPPGMLPAKGTVLGLRGASRHCKVHVDPSKSADPIPPALRVQRPHVDDDAILQVVLFHAFVSTVDVARMPALRLRSGWYSRSSRDAGEDRDHVSLARFQSPEAS